MHDQEKTEMKHKMLFGASMLILLTSGCSERRSTFKDQIAHDLKLTRLRILTEAVQGSNAIANDSLLFDSVNLRTAPSSRLWLISTNYQKWRQVALQASLGSN